MPWTFAHPAAVLPLRRLRHFRALRSWPFDALVAGSLAPDLGYYLAWPAAATLAHVPAGLVLVDLPAGLALLLAWRVLREPVAALLPRRHRRAWRADRAAASGARGAGSAARDAAALVIGGATHLAWDAATHAHGWIVQHVPALQASLGRIGDREFPLFNVLQHGSTIAGVVVLLLAYRRHVAARAPRSAAGPADGARLARLLALAAGACAAAAAITLAGRAAPTGVSGAIARLVEAVVLATDLFAAAIVAAALLAARARRGRGARA